MSSRRDLSKAYKERPQRGGVYTITNMANGRYLLGRAANLDGVRNRFQFAVTTGSTVDPRLRDDWRTFGAQAFVLEIREELEQRPDQIQAAFLDDLKTLEDLWRAQLDAAKAY